MKVRVVDGNGARGIVHNDLAVEAEEPISEEVRRFLEETRRSRDGSVTLDALEPSFLVDLYVRTSVRKVEPIPPEGTRERARWNRVCARYGPPTGGAERTGDGGVVRGDDPTPDAPTRSPNVGGAGE